VEKLPPIFIKGHLNLRVGNLDLEYIHQNLSVFGVTGLPWEPLSPEVHFGKMVSVQLRIPGDDPLVIQCKAVITRESTLYAEQMGLRFVLDAQQKAQFQRVVSNRGVYPTDYLRKYPRIPVDLQIQSFPTRVVVSLPDGESVVCDVSNLIPFGILVHTENQAALMIHPGSLVRVTVEPRGWFPKSVTCEGMVCRVMDDRGRESQNIVRHLGIKFTQMDTDNKELFLMLLRDILNRIQGAKAQ